MKSINNIIGVDKTLISSGYEDNIGILDIKTIGTVKKDYTYIKYNVFEQLKERINNQSIVFKKNDENNIDSLLKEEIELIEDITNLVVLTRTALDNSLMGANLTPTMLDGLKSILDGKKTIASAELQILKGLEQSKDQSYINYNNALLAYQTAKDNDESAKIQVELDIDSTKKAVEVQQAGVVKAEAGLALLLSDPRKEELNSLNATVNSAIAGYDSAMYNFNKSLIRSSIDAVVNAIYVDFGDYISPGQIIASVASDNGFEIETYLNENDAKKIALKSNSIINNKYNGIVIEKSNAIDSITKKVKIKIYITDTNPDLTLGEITKIKINTIVKEDNEKELYMLPLSSVKISEQKSFVAVVNKDNRIDFVEITLGEIIGDKVQVFDGITTDMSIVESLKGLEQNLSVKIAQ